MYQFYLFVRLYYGTKVGIKNSVYSLIYYGLYTLMLLCCSVIRFENTWKP